MILDDVSIFKELSKPIFLVGFMGCGKSTLGKKLANKYALEFIDLDSLIENRLNMNVADIFSNKGEQGFRMIESDTLKTLQCNQTAVIATGGGAPCYHDNMMWMNKVGLTIFLNPPVHILINRLKNAKVQRPLIAEKSELELTDFILNKLQERLKFYQMAKVILDSADIKVNDIAQSIRNLS